MKLERRERGTVARKVAETMFSGHAAIYVMVNLFLLFIWAATGMGSPQGSQTPAASASWVIKVDPSPGKILGKAETTNADFIDVGEHKEILAGAARAGFTWYGPPR